ncbi:MAG: radical SAM protein, partial [bacterium]|nr:radical SAM protein [bacterium]
MHENWTDFFEAVEEFPFNRRLKFKKLCIVGNEPLLFPKLQETIALAVKNGFREIEVLTSGGPLSDIFFLRELVQAGVTSFSLPLFGSTAETHDRIVQKKGSFRELMTALGSLKQVRGIRVFIHTNLLKQNLNELPALERLVTREFGFPFAILPTRTKFTNLPFREYTPSYREVISTLKGKVRSLLGFPYCIQRTVQKTDTAVVSDSMKLYFIHQRFIKPAPCRTCLYFNRCPGVFRDYLKVYS